MHVRAALVLFIFTFLLTFPSFFNPLLDRASDLDGNITQIIYIKDSLVKHHIFPQWNPYINQGIPISADPLHSAFHPLVMPAFILLTPDIAVKFLYFISLYFGGLGLYILLHRLKIYPVISIFSAFTLISCGYISSHIVAGHFEKVLSFGILPWFLMSLYEVFTKQRTKYELVSAILMTLILFSGDIYNTLYAGIIVLTVGAFKQSNKAWVSTIRILVFFCLLGSIKLIPLIELQDYIGKAKEPFAGSQNIISILYYFFIPIKPLFMAFGVGKYLETGFAWWEKVAFIGPLSLIGIALFFVRRKFIFSMQSRFFVYIGVVLILISMPAQVWNPFSWIIMSVPGLQLFHVPSRVFGMLTILFLVLCALGYQRWYALRNIYIRSGIVITLVANVCITCLFFLYIVHFRQMNVKHSQTSTELIYNIKRRDKRVYYIAQYLQEHPLQQHKLISLEQKVLNSNYGFQLKNSPATAYTRFDFSTEATYVDIQPMYIVGGESIRISQGTQPGSILKKSTMVLYENFAAHPYASLEQSGKEIENVTIHPNMISVEVTSSNQDNLTLLESYYPGWKVYKDGKPIEFIKDRFLKAPVMKGVHQYDFIFVSYSFLAGLGISVISWTVALGALLRRRNSLHV